MTQQASHRPIKCQSSLCSQRGIKVNGSHHGDNPLLRPTGIQIATRPLPSPTNREHWKPIGVKTMSLSTNCSFYYHTSYRERLSDVLPIQQVIKSETKSFLALGGLQEDKLCDILQAMAPTYIETVHQTSLLHIECNLDRLGLLLPTHGQRSTAQNGQTTLQSVLINKPKFLKAILRADIRKIEIPRSMVVEALCW